MTLTALKHLNKNIFIPVFIFLLGAVWAFHTSFAQIFDIGSSSKFFVIPSNTLDCTDRYNPKTKIGFIVSHEGNGTIRLKKTGLDGWTTPSTTAYLPNGLYAWDGVVGTDLNREFSQMGSFELNASCQTSFGSKTTDNNTSNEVAFSVLPTSFLDCSDPKNPKAKVDFTANPASDSVFEVTSSKGETVMIKSGNQSFSTGFYTWKVGPFASSSGVSLGQGTFNLGTMSCPVIPVKTETQSEKKSELKIDISQNPFMIGDEADCSVSILNTPVKKIIETEGKILLLSKDKGATFVSYQGEEISLPNGLYYWKIESKQENSNNQILSEGSFSLNKHCGSAILKKSNEKDISTEKITEKIKFEKPHQIIEVEIKNKNPEIDKIINKTEVTIINKTDIAKDKKEKIEYQEAVLKSNAEQEKAKVSQKAAESVLAKVASPELCVNKQECRIYCAEEEAKGEDLCKEYIFSNILVGKQKGDNTPSLFDGVADGIAENIISKSNVPDVVKTSDDLNKYCSDLNNADLCFKLLIDNKLATSENLEKKKDEILIAKEELKNTFNARVGARVFIDTDFDGVSDYDERYIYNTDPNNIDSDRDGYLDGVEVLFRTNPNDSKDLSKNEDKLISENNPLVAGVSLPDLFSVKEIAVTETATSTRGEMTAKKILISGVAQPNSYITLYIFSNPIIVTLKTNESGEWSYTLDKELPDGAHKVVVAVTDNTGRVLAKSESVPFTKVAEAVTFEDVQTVIPESKKLGFFTGTSLYILIFSVFAIFIFSLASIGIITRRRTSATGVRDFNNL